MSLFIERNPVTLARNFHDETQLPVLAVSGSGSVLSELGAARRDPEILDQLIRQMVGPRRSGFQAMTLSDAQGNSYTAAYLFHSQKHHGFLLIGPYQGNVHKVCEPSLCQFNQLFHESDDNRPCPLPICAKGLSPKLRTALNYMMANFQSPLTIEEVAAQAGCSKTYFCTLFKKELSLTFTAFLNQVRIEEAKLLLQSSASSMLDIALAVGYNNQNYFSIQFKKVTGLTPGEYRKTRRY